METETAVGSGGPGLTTSSSASHTSFQVAQQASATGSISIDELDLDGRFVRLKNSSDQDQSLGNWRIRRQGAAGEEIAYKFTPKYVLRAGQTVTVSWGRVATHQGSDPALSA